MPKVDLNGSSLLVTVAVILILLETISVIWKGFEAWQNLSGKKKRNEEIAKIHTDINGLGRRVTECENRLSRGDNQFTESRQDSEQMLIILESLLMHFISGNDHEKLRETHQKLTAYMARRRD